MPSDPDIDALDVGPSCKLAIWISKHHVVNNLGAPLTLKELYDEKLDSIMTKIDSAMQDPDSVNYIHPGKAALVREAIGKFKSGDEHKIQTMLLNNVRRQSNGASNTVSGFLHRVAQLGVYFPNNHTEPNDKNAINDLLEGRGRYEKPLWDVVGDYEKVPRTFGDFKFYELFNLKLCGMSHNLRQALHEAKRLGVIRQHPNHRDIGDPSTPAPLTLLGDVDIDFVNSGNSKCCQSSICQSSIYSADYCQAVSSTDTSCNAMSDPCHM